MNPANSDNIEEAYRLAKSWTHFVNEKGVEVSGFALNYDQQHASTSFSPDSKQSETQKITYKDKWKIWSRTKASRHRQRSATLHNESPINPNSRKIIKPSNIESPENNQSKDSEEDIDDRIKELEQRYKTMTDGNIELKKKSQAILEASNSLLKDYMSLMENCQQLLKSCNINGEKSG